ncbi:MAG: uroporphyrinogen decarboxylase [Flavobacteriaceae bacterium]|nr:uroporphyrinogen decarboxylase [Flavobacteriaceae bacterium]|tara:strand:+ start:168 stop:401 length:234 start_codon:yes stop_codon:yes gene_type:complete
MDTLDIIGWAAAIFVIISFLINNMLWLRIINMVGASLWLTYGIIDTSYSIIFLNVIIVSIQFFKISLILKDKNLNLK